MTIVQLIETSQSWLVWLAIGLAALALLSFLFKWDIRFRLIGTTIFTTLLCGSCWAFVSSYSPPFRVEGALYAPIVYDNGNDLVIAQASKDFPKESIQATLEQIAGNLKGGGRKRQNVIVRLRKVQSSTEGIDNPIIIGEVIRNINEAITTNSTQEYE